VDKSSTTTTGVACYYYVQHKVCFLCSPASSPLTSFFTHSAELKEFDDARRLHFANIHLFFIFEYLFILFLLYYFFFIIQRSQQKKLGNVVVVGSRVFCHQKSHCVIIIIIVEVLGLNIIIIMQQLLQFVVAHHLLPLIPIVGTS